jgi:hypothetical protein
LLQLTDVWELNVAATGPTGSACAGNLRPGRYALAKTPTGVDSHLLSVHLDGGRASRDYKHRRQAARRIGPIRVANTPILELDRDVLMLGDYNTMGREDAPPLSGQQELTAFDGELAPGFRRLPITPTARSTSRARAAPWITWWSAPACRGRPPAPALRGTALSPPARISRAPCRPRRSACPTVVRWSSTSRTVIATERGWRDRTAR